MIVLIFILNCTVIYAGEKAERYELSWMIEAESVIRDHGNVDFNGDQLRSWSSSPTRSARINAIILSCDELIRRIDDTLVLRPTRSHSALLKIIADLKQLVQKTRSFRDWLARLVDEDSKIKRAAIDPPKPSLYLHQYKCKRQFKRAYFEFETLLEQFTYAVTLKTAFEKRLHFAALEDLNRKVTALYQHCPEVDASDDSQMTLLTEYAKAHNVSAIEALAGFVDANAANAENFFDDLLQRYQGFIAMSKMIQTLAQTLKPTVQSLAFDQFLAQLKPSIEKIAIVKRVKRYTTLLAELRFYKHHKALIASHDMTSNDLRTPSRLSGETFLIGAWYVQTFYLARLGRSTAQLAETISETLALYLTITADIKVLQLQYANRATSIKAFFDFVDPSTPLAHLVALKNIAPSYFKSIMNRVMIDFTRERYKRLSTRVQQTNETYLSPALQTVFSIARLRQQIETEQNPKYRTPAQQLPSIIELLKTTMILPTSQLAINASFAYFFQLMDANSDRDHDPLLENELLHYPAVAKFITNVVTALHDLEKWLDDDTEVLIEGN